MNLKTDFEIDHYAERMRAELIERLDHDVAHLKQTMGEALASRQWLHEQKDLATLISKAHFVGSSLFEVGGDEPFNVDLRLGNIAIPIAEYRRGFSILGRGSFRALIILTPVKPL